MPRNVLVVGVIQGCINLVVEGRPSISSLKDEIKQREGIPPDSYFLVHNGSPVEDSYELEDAGDYSTTILRAYTTIKGGKGGFGSLIRAMGMQINKSTNKNACRDLSGRRVRDVKAEKEILEWTKKEPERQRQRVEEKRRRLEKRRAAPKHYFHDPKYMEQIQNNVEEVQDALRQGMEAATSSSVVGKRKYPTSEHEESRDSDDSETSKKKAKLWLGMEGLTSSSEDESDQEMTTLPGNGAQDSQDQASCSGCVTVLNSGEEEEGSLANPTSACADGRTNDSCHADTNCSKVTTSSIDRIPLADSCFKTSAKTSTDATVTMSPSTSAVSTGNAQSEACTKADDTLEVVCLDRFTSAEQLESVGGECLKITLQKMGLKCGGTIKERAQRLFSTKGKKLEELDHTLFAKPVKKK